MKKKIVLAAGGTGGHLIPAQAIASELVQLGHEVAFLGCNLHENAFFDRNTFSFRHIPASPFSLNIPRFVFKMTQGLFQARSFLSDFRPDMVIGFGSYHTVPVLTASVLQAHPFVLFAADAHPGRVIRLFSKKAQWTACYFKEAQAMLKGQKRMVQFPLRSQFRELPCKKESCRRYGLPEDMPILLVLGGSLGAAIFNTLIPSAVAEMDLRIAVIHMCGKNAAASEVKKEYARFGIEACVLTFEDHMEYAYQAADCIVARSGASTIAEIRQCGKKALYIPYPYAVDDHQAKNAKIATLNDHAVAVLQADASPSTIAKNITGLFLDPVRTRVVPDDRASFVQLLEL